jgi:LPXTG-motif cell wall-anchored protein
MRFARVAACTAATALLTVAAGTGTASAATQKKGLLYTATSSTGVLELRLALPVAVPGVPNPTGLTLLGTEAQAFRDLSGADIATARSYLAGGNLVTGSTLSGLLTPLNRTVEATLASPGLHKATSLSVPANPLGLDLAVGNQSAAVNAVSRLTSSDGRLTSASLGSLRTLGLGAALDTALAQLTAAIATVTAQSAALTSALSSVPALPVISVPNPLAGIIPGVPATISTPALSGTALAGTVSALPAQVDAILAKLTDGALVTLSAVGTGQKLAPALSSLASTAGTDAADVSLLGGLITVSATKAAVAATSGLTKKAASATASATLLDVKIATALTDLLSLTASDKGITAGLLDGTLLGSALAPAVQALVTTIDAALNTVLAELTDLLSSLNSGAKLITQGTVTKTVSADGHRAEAHAVPAQVTIGLPIAPNLVTLSLGKADVVSALSVANPTVVTPTTPQELPHTGGSQLAALVALTLVGLAGGTVLLRRRQQV